MAAYEKQGETDEWYTPAYIFDALGVSFDLDVAAPKDGPRYVPTSQWISAESLEKDWFGFVWMNPPFGHQSTKREWLAKFFEHGNGIALLPDRTSAPWWQEFAPVASCVLFVSPKVKFERPDGSIGGQPGTGTTLLAAGDQAAIALKMLHDWVLFLNQSTTRNREVFCREDDRVNRSRSHEFRNMTAGCGGRNLFDAVQPLLRSCGLYSLGAKVTGNWHVGVASDPLCKIPTTQRDV